MVKRGSLQAEKVRPSAAARAWPLDRRDRRRWGWVFGATALLWALILVPPFVDAGMRAVVMSGFSTVCHQLPFRSPHLGGVPLAVCYRCFGIYSAMPLALLAFLLWKGLRLADWGRAGLVVALLLPGLDWLAGVLDWWQSPPAVRLATGCVFGFWAGVMLARAVVRPRRAQPEEARAS